jgi:hypothetical protein
LKHFVPTLLEAAGTFGFLGDELPAVGGKEDVPLVLEGVDELTEPELFATARSASNIPCGDEEAKYMGRK